MNASCSSGWTPLMTACDENHEGVVKLLLAHRADQSMRLADGRTAFDLLPGDQEVSALYSGIDESFGKQGITCLATRA